MKHSAPDLSPYQCLGEALGEALDKWQTQVRRRGWTPELINEAIATGRRYPAPNYVNPGSTATRMSAREPVGRW